MRCKLTGESALVLGLADELECETKVLPRVSGALKSGRDFTLDVARGGNLELLRE